MSEMSDQEIENFVGNMTCEECIQWVKNNWVGLVIGRIQEMISDCNKEMEEMISDIKMEREK
jgi:hypothetical protein